MANILFVFVTGYWDHDFEYAVLQKYEIIISFVLMGIHIFLCLFLRFKRKEEALKGIFYYQMIGALAYVVCFINFMRGESNFFFENLYNWLTIFYQPGVVMISRIIQIKLQFMMAIVYFILVIITGSSILEMRKDIAFYKKVEEDKLHI